MESVLGTSLSVFIGVTCLLMGFAAFSTGQALAKTWRPMWQILPYGILLGLVDRFLTFALFGGELLSASGYIIDTAVLLGIAGLSYRAMLARRMVTQYPWLYEPVGPLAWRERTHARGRDADAG